MSRKRACFASSVCCSDAFSDLSAEAQALYLQLGFCADADGAVDGIRKAVRASGFGTEALGELYGAGFLLDADGVPFVAHWHVNNRIDRLNYRPGDHANLVGTVVYLGEDRVYRLSGGYQADDSLMSDANISKSKLTEEKASEINPSQSNESEGKAHATLTAPCPSCGIQCAAYVDPLKQIISRCPEHGDFIITEDGEVL